MRLNEPIAFERRIPNCHGGELLQIWQNYVARIWANDISAEEGCTSAVEEINAIIDET